MSLLKESVLSGSAVVLVVLVVPVGSGEVLGQTMCKLEICQLYIFSSYEVGEQNSPLLRPTVASPVKQFDHLWANGFVFTK